jgi:hypothetical protein
VQNVWRVGAEPPPPQLEEDAEDDGSAGTDRGEPSLFLFSARGETDAQSSARIGSPENRRKLETALDELLACRRIIEGVLGQS